MTRRTNLGKEWNDLLSQAGSVAAIYEAIGMDQVAFYRATRSRIPFPPEAALALQVMCDAYGIDNPATKIPKPRNKDLQPLSLLGEAIQRDLPLSDREIQRVREMYPTAQLVELAESDGTPERILLAVTRLLES